MEEKKKAEKVKIVSNCSYQLGGVNKKCLGVIILSLGVLMLGNGLSWWQVNFNWSIFFAFLIIVFGLKLIFKGKC